VTVDAFRQFRRGHIQVGRRHLVGYPEIESRRTGKEPDHREMDQGRVNADIAQANHEISCGSKERAELPLGSAAAGVPQPLPDLDVEEVSAGSFQEDGFAMTDATRDLRSPRQALQSLDHAEPNGLGHRMKGRPSQFPRFACFQNIGKNHERRAFQRQTRRPVRRPKRPVPSRR
jgi:hypothetical protein